MSAEHTAISIGILKMPGLARCVQSQSLREVELSTPRSNELDAEFRVATGETIMLSWGITFLVLALIAAVPGFGVLSGAAMTAAKVCIGVFLILAVVSMITGRRVTS